MISRSLEKILQVDIIHIIPYLVKALLEPVSLKPKTCVIPDHQASGDSDYCYVMMTIWYVWKYFKKNLKYVSRFWLSDWVIQSGMEGSNCPPTLLQPHYHPSDDWTFAVTDRNKLQLLQW
jgi:hypothetical protein